MNDWWPMIGLLYGLVLGSFCNALVWRLHEGKSIADGRSMCPNCKHKLVWYDLIPVISWALLGGACRYCHKPISLQYPLIELLTGGLFALSIAVLPRSNTLEVVQLVIWLAVVLCGVTLAVYDAKWYELPNKVMLPMLGLAATSFILVVLQGQSTTQSVLMAAMAGVVAAIFYALWYFSDGKLMGGADSKLALAMGLLLSPANFAVSLFISFMSSGVVAAYLLFKGKKSRKSMLPFGPFLLIGLFVAKLYGPQIVDWYTTLLI